MFLLFFPANFEIYFDRDFCESAPALFFRLKKTVQIFKAAVQDLHLLLAQVFYNGFDHLFVKITVVVKRLFSLLCQSHIHHPFVLLTPLPANITFFLKPVHIDRQGAYRDMKFLGNHGHVSEAVYADGFYYMHIIVGNILEFLRNYSISLHVHHMVEQIDQHLIQRTFPILRHPAFRTLFPFFTRMLPVDTYNIYTLFVANVKFGNGIPPLSADRASLFVKDRSLPSQNTRAIRKSRAEA